MIIVFALPRVKEFQSCHYEVRVSHNLPGQKKQMVASITGTRQEAMLVHRKLNVNIIRQQSHLSLVVHISLSLWLKQEQRTIGQNMLLPMAPSTTHVIASGMPKTHASLDRHLPIFLHRVIQKSFFADECRAPELLL